LDFIWYKGNKTNNRTYPFLPNCNGPACRLNGSEAYHAILNYFTTKDIHPNEVHNLGWANLDRLYPQVISLLVLFLNVFRQEVFTTPEMGDSLLNLTPSHISEC